MGWLFLSVACSVTIANLLRWYGSGKRSSILSVFAGNYLFATAFGLWLNGGLTGLISRAGDEHSLLPLYLIGALCGVFLIVNFLIFEKNIGQNGLALPVSVMRASTVIPVLLSLVLFGETIGWLNGAGITIILAAFLMLGGRNTPRSMVWLLLLFLISGFTEYFFKLNQEWNGVVFSKAPDGIRETRFIVVAFGTALVVNIVLLFIRRIKIRMTDLLRGISIGIPNMLNALFLMYALRTVPGAIAYPVLASNVVLGGFLTDVIIWRSRFDRKRLMIFGLLLIGVILLNL